MKAPAVFLDRDGTIIENHGYLGDPDGVTLLPGAVDGLRRLADAGYLLVLVSNQSGVARGYFDEEALSRVHARLEAELHRHGVSLDGCYYCPYLDGEKATVEAYRKESELRKPKPGMLLQAAEELGIDLAESWMIGDSLSDVEAGRRAGCRTVLIANGHLPAFAGHNTPDHVAPSLDTASGLVALSRPSTVPVRVTSSANDNTLILSRILEELETSRRVQRQDDFSVAQMLATLLQMLTVITGAWGALALFNDRHPEATARLALAALLQLAAIAALVMHKMR